MHESSIQAGGSGSTLLAVVLIVVLLVAVMFVGGKPNDVRGGRWQLKLVGILVLLGVVFLLSKAVSRLTYQACEVGVRCH